MTKKVIDDLSVFINCPFDSNYVKFFQAIVFTVKNCGFKPRCAFEVDNGGQTRIDKLTDIIRECRFGIHDISETNLDQVNGLPRFNMPFELGLFLGACMLGSKAQATKISIILDCEKYRYQKFISDIAGQDVKAHNNDLDTLIKGVRNFLNMNTDTDTPMPNAQKIIDDFQEISPIISKPEIAVDGDYNDLIYAMDEFLKFKYPNVD